MSDIDPVITARLLDVLRKTGLTNVIPRQTISVDQLHMIRQTNEEIDDSEPPVFPSASPIGKGKDQLDVLNVQSVLTKKRFYHFLMTWDCKHVAVPVVLMPPGVLPDPILKEWVWWEGEGADKVKSFDTAMSVAKSILVKHERVDMLKESAVKLRKCKRLRAMAKLLKEYEGEPISYSDLNRLTGISFQEIRELIDYMRGQKKWPYKMAKGGKKRKTSLTGERLEGAVLVEIIDKLFLLPSEASIRDVLARAEAYQPWTKLDYKKTRNISVPLLRPYQDRIIKAAAEIARYGDPVSSKAIAERLGMSRGAIRVEIHYMRRKGAWPFLRGIDGGTKATKD